MSLRRLVPAALIAGLAAIAAVGASATPSASRTLDRTFSCSVLLRAGARIVEVSARSGTRDAGNRRWWAYNPAVGVEDRDTLFASVAAGAPSAEQGARPAPPPAEGYFPVVERWLALDPRLCTATTSRIPLSARGLTGGKASRLPGLEHVGADAFECPAASRVLVRVRAAFDRSTSLKLQLRAGRRTLSTSNAAVVRSAAIAVATPDGKRIAYAEISDSGVARLFTLSTCTPD